MDDEEAALSSDLLLSELDRSLDMDEIMRDGGGTCMHTHTCNPPGPDARGHTHTCYHTHTRVFGEDDGTANYSRRPSGNREAVRKYREKKKAHTAYLEEEVKKLRQANQQLLRRLQGQAELEVEVQRLRALLADLRGKIDSGIGTFPDLQKQCSGTMLQCGAYHVPCADANGRKVGRQEAQQQDDLDDGRISNIPDFVASRSRPVRSEFTQMM